VHALRTSAALLLLAACDDGTTVFTTVQPAGMWVDLAGTQVTSGPDLEFIDSRGLSWLIDWRTGQPSAWARYPRQIFSRGDCHGGIYLEATTPPLHVVAKPSGDLFFAKPNAYLQVLPEAWTDDGPGCTRVGGDVTVYRVEDVIALHGAPRTSYVPPLRKVLPDEHGDPPAE
jgi:hypothetical protein